MVNDYNKLPQITLSFWIMKICATTLGETAGDLLSMTLKIGYALSSIILITLFLLSLAAQLRSKKYIPLLYWLVILTTSTAGTTISDYMDRTLELGYMKGALILITLLISILTFWKIKFGSLSVKNIKSFKVELTYWSAILTSNTLGTAFGDYIADDLGLGFFGGAALTSAVLVAVALAYYFSSVSRVILFWIAFVVTRPLGATVGDFLTKSNEKGGLDLGTVGSSAILFTVLVGLIIFTGNQASRPKSIETA